MKQIALLISHKQRCKILVGDYINKAVGISDNEQMKFLMLVWKEFIEPDLNVTCNLCYARVLENFRKLQPILIELEKEYRCLD